MAAPVLSELGFELVDDPRTIRNPYLLTGAIYRSKRGLFLSVGFDPFDSNTASISCGRPWRWRKEGGRFLLSNGYSALARRFGIELPPYYTLGYDDAIAKTIERMLSDLQRTLPTVIERTTLEDLIAVEHEQFGAHQSAAAHAGPDYLEQFEITDYPS